MFPAKVLHQPNGFSEPTTLWKSLTFFSSVEQPLIYYIWPVEDRMKLPSAMLRSVTDRSGVPEAVVFCETAIEVTCMKCYLQTRPLRNTT